MVQLGDPDRQVGQRRNFIEFGRPFLDPPQIPIERKSVDRHDIDLVEDADARHPLQEQGIDRQLFSHQRKLRLGHGTNQENIIMNGKGGPMGRASLR